MYVSFWSLDTQSALIIDQSNKQTHKLKKYSKSTHDRELTNETFYTCIETICPPWLSGNLVYSSCLSLRQNVLLFMAFYPYTTYYGSKGRLNHVMSHKVGQMMGIWRVYNAVSSGENHQLSIICQMNRRMYTFKNVMIFFSKVVKMHS